MLIAGGPPCQGFSSAGLRNPDDPRNSLTHEYIRIVKLIQPKYLLLENVRGFQAKFSGKSEPFSASVARKLNKLEPMGYHIHAHRQHFLSSSPKRWDEFYNAMNDDEPNVAIVALYHALRRSGRYEMVIVSARPGKYRSITEIWLSENGIEYEKLIMRHDGDFRPDAEAKRDMLCQITDNLDDIAFVVDDRTKTVRMWRSLGLICLQCAEHDY